MFFSKLFQIIFFSKLYKENNSQQVNIEGNEFKCFEKKIKDVGCNFCHITNIKIKKCNNCGKRKICKDCYYNDCEKLCKDCIDYDNWGETINIEYSYEVQKQYKIKRFF